jgi:hypothetical protein
VHWNGVDPGDHFQVRLDDEAVLEKLEAFGATTGRHVRWEEVARLPDAPE